MSFEEGVALYELALYALGVATGNNSLAVSVLLMARRPGRGAGGTSGMLRVALRGGLAEIACTLGVARRHLP